MSNVNIGGRSRHRGRRRLRPPVRRRLAGPK
jgi:hypothetical protein